MPVYGYQDIKEEDPCFKLAWQTKIGTKDKYTDTVWAAESPDGKYYIVGGVEENAAGLNDQTIWKINSKDGSVMWKMSLPS